MTADRDLDIGVSLVDQARLLMARAGDGNRDDWRWKIRIDVFDCIRDRPVFREQLHMPIDDEPRFLGIPYDLEWPAAGAFIVLERGPPLAWPAPHG